MGGIGKVNRVFMVLYRASVSRCGVSPAAQQKKCSSGKKNLESLQRADKTNKTHVGKGP